MPVPFWNIGAYSLLVMGDARGLDKLAQLQIEGRVPRLYRFVRPAAGRGFDRSPAIVRRPAGAPSAREARK